MSVNSSARRLTARPPALITVSDGKRSRNVCVDKRREPDKKPPSVKPGGVSLKVVRSASVMLNANAMLKFLGAQRLGIMEP